ncbi:MAG TPA: 5'-3' exonuclease H3TH domain-containing protein [Candidatus Acidoferrum sp.]|nr:5'-3' exonuclease H3TH domain-containing protein [Candidatus Acidoferrum sp.]
MTAARVFLVDASIYIFRAWHIYETTITDRNGKPVNAVFGFSDFLYQLLRQAQPRHIACAFDASQRNSFRKEIYPDYKANREPAPEQLKYQFALCREFCRAVGIAEFGSERYEADDIIGSLAYRYRRQGHPITVISADKDLTQLVVNDDDQWWDFARGTVLNQHGVKKHFGVRPEQIADMLALSGDKIDNIPGIPGVGYATAAKILQKYDSIESILANHDRIADMKFRGAARVQVLLKSHGHLLPRNKLLTTVATDMEFHAAPDLDWRGIDVEAFNACSEQLGFRGLMQQRWLNLAAPEPVAQA